MGKLYKKISIIGAGTWGIAIANHLSLKTSVSLTHYRKSFLRDLENKRSHPNIENFILPKIINIDYENKNKADLYVIAVPVQYIRSVLDSIRISSNSSILLLSKGIEKETLFFPSQIIKDKLNRKDKKIAVLSGPSHAEQVLKKYPTSVVVSSYDEQFSKQIQILFSDQNFRVYSNIDILGVELGGAVKNVISIAAGIVYGLGYRENTLSALLIRGIHEIKKIGLALGAKKDTLNGLSGLGDLMATAFSDNSRNRYVGIEVANGKKIKDIIRNLNMNAEGVETAKSLHSLSKKNNIKLPICEMVYKVLHCNKDPQDSIKELMNRRLRAEF